MGAEVLFASKAIHPGPASRLSLPCASWPHPPPHGSSLQRWMCGTHGEGQETVLPLAACRGRGSVLAAGPRCRAKLARGKAGPDPSRSRGISARSAWLARPCWMSGPSLNRASLCCFSQGQRGEVVLSQQSSQSTRKRRKVSEPLLRIIPERK